MVEVICATKCVVGKFLQINLQYTVSIILGG